MVHICIFSAAAGNGIFLFLSLLRSIGRPLLFLRCTLAGWADSYALTGELRTGWGIYWTTQNIKSCAFAAENRPPLVASGSLFLLFRGGSVEEKSNGGGRRGGRWQRNYPTNTLLTGMCTVERGGVLAFWWWWWWSFGGIA